MDITPEAPVHVTGLPFEGYNVATLYNSWLVMLILIVLGVLAVRSLALVPGRWQAALELITEFLEDICDSALGRQHGRKYMPFIATLFLFVFLSNAIGIVPNVLAPLGWPGFICPTQDLNTPLGLALMVLFVVHISAIRIKGFRGWLWSFFEPSFPGDRAVTKAFGLVSFAGAGALNYVFIRKYLSACPSFGPFKCAVWGLVVSLFLCVTALVTMYSFQLKRVPNVAMAPLNFVGEIGKAISHPFRLFGNIFGGSVILAVALNLAFTIAMPAVLKGSVAGVLGVAHAVGIAFFGLFIGLVQAFVFAMLALAYTAVQISE